MAGTRLLLQSIVLIELLIIVWISIQYGFCHSHSHSQNQNQNQGKGSIGLTTKDIPRLIFLTDDYDDDDGSEIEMNNPAAEWWEESLCHPINSMIIS